MNVIQNKISSVFFKYAIPSVLGMLLVTSASIIDGFFIGNYVGPSGIAAINISLPVFSLLIGFSFMLAVGSSAISGKLLGEGDTKNVSIVFSKTITIVTIFSLIICTILFLNIETILRLFGANKDLMVLATQYLHTILFFTPFFMISFILNYFVRLDNRPNLALISFFISAIINIILDWILIAYFKQGIFGAAFATGISQLAIFIILLPHFFSKKATIKFVKPIGSYMQILRATGNGSSEFINEISIGITTMIFNYVMLSSFGVEGLAAFTIINYIIWTGVLINYGISDSLQPIISKNFGAKKPLRIKSFLKFAFSSVLIVGFVMIALITIVPEELTDIFLGKSGEKSKVIVLAFAYLVWPVFLFNGINLTISAYFTAMHKPIPSGLIALSRSIIFPLFFIYILPIIFSQNGIFLAIPAAEMVTFIIALILFKKMTPDKIIFIKKLKGDNHI